MAAYEWWLRDMRFQNSDLTKNFWYFGKLVAEVVATGVVTVFSLERNFMRQNSVAGLENLLALGYWTGLR